MTHTAPLMPLSSLLAGLLIALAPTAQAMDVGVSVQISQPGVHGRIDIGRFPSPVLVQAQPVVVAPLPSPVQPIYMWVPYEHQRHWHRYCASYRACGVPVYFVQDAWYQRTVMAPPPPVYAPPPPPPRYEPTYRHSHHGHDERARWDDRGRWEDPRPAPVMQAPRNERWDDRHSSERNAPHGSPVYEPHGRHRDGDRD